MFVLPPLPPVEAGLLAGLILLAPGLAFAATTATGHLGYRRRRSRWEIVAADLPRLLGPGPYAALAAHPDPSVRDWFDQNPGLVHRWVAEKQPGDLLVAAIAAGITTREIEAHLDGRARFKDETIRLLAGLDEG